MAEKFTFSKEDFKKQVKDYVKVVSRKTIEEASQLDIYTGVAYGLKDYIIDQWIATHKEYEARDVKTVYYLSMEFLTGRALGNIIINLSARDEIKEAIEELGLDLNVIEDQEPDAALGNGGLGRLRHASLILWQLLDIRHMAAVYAINTVCLSKKLLTAIR